jgi:hypothetical protein
VSREALAPRRRVQQASGDSLTLTMGDDQFTIDLLDHLLKF